MRAIRYPHGEMSSSVKSIADLEFCALMEMPG